MKEKRSMKKRISMMLAGIAFIALCVGCYRMSGFGVDAFSCMNLGISSFIGMSFGNWQLIMNAVILIAVFFTVRDKIGIGTLINMAGVGYGADFICWLVQEHLQVQMTLPLRVAALAAGCLFAAVGVAFYIEGNLGIAPYDSVAFILEKLTRGKLSFQYGRVVSDVSVVVIGVVFCLAHGGNVWEIAGVGTVVNACFNGPMIQFFRRLINGSRPFPRARYGRIPLS